jgi:hypothetical protein
VLLGASLGPPYSDERQLAERWLQWQGSKGWGEGLWLVAHALYGMGREVLSQVRRLGWRAVVAVGEGVWRGVKREERQWAQRPWQKHRDIYRRRYLVESWLYSALFSTECGPLLGEPVPISPLLLLKARTARGLSAHHAALHHAITHHACHHSCHHVAHHLVHHRLHFLHVLCAEPEQFVQGCPLRPIQRTRL